MAKLSARGRRELLRMERITAPAGLSEEDCKETKSGEIGPTIRTEVVLMSDGKMLRKVTWMHPTPHDSGWKVIGKLKRGMTVDDFRRAYKGPSWKVIGKETD